MKKLLFVLMLLCALIFTGCGEKTPELPEEPEIKEYKVTFEENGGSKLDDFLLEEGKTLTLPEISKEGYTFIGWYTDSNYQEEATDNISISKDLTLYAKWEINSYNVKFEGSDLEDIVIEYNNTITKVTPEKEGYTFKGWYIDSEYSELYSFTKKVKEDITLYAK